MGQQSDFLYRLSFFRALHFLHVINLVNSILYGTHWYWLATAPHQLRWSWKWRNFLWLFISFWWCRNPAFYYHSQNRTSIRVRITCVEILLNQRNSWIHTIKIMLVECNLSSDSLCAMLSHMQIKVFLHDYSSCIII